MTDYPRDPQRRKAWLQLNSWALAIATALLVLLIAGVLPRISW